MDLSGQLFENFIIQNKHQHFTNNRIRIGVIVRVRVRFNRRRKTSVYKPYCTYFQKTAYNALFQTIINRTTAESNNCQIKQLFSNNCQTENEKWFF